MSDINDTLSGIQTAFNELKSTNEAKLKDMATKGSVDTLIESKMAAINETISELEKKVARDVGNVQITEADAAVIEHKNAFDKWQRKGVGEYELEALERKALTIAGDGTQGGYALPKQVEAGIYNSLRTISPIRQLATVIQVSGDDYRILANQQNMGAGWVGETAARPETATPTLAELKVPMGEIYANPMVSQRALDDLAFNVDQFMIDETSVKFAQMENAAFITGDGVNKPQGILTTSGIPYVATGVAAGMPASSAGADFVIAMIQKLPAAYRQGASFVTASAMVSTIRTLKDSTGGYLWQPSLVAGTPSTLAGYSITEAEEMPGVAAGNFPIAFGNIAQGYLIADRIGIRTLRDPYTNKPFVGFYSTKRVGGMVRDKNAFVLLKVAAS